MRLLIDTNVVLDVLQAREGHYEDSALVWKICETKKAEGYLTTLSFANLVYVLRKELTPERIDKVREQLSMIFRFEDFTVADVIKASKDKWNDFEDAVQNAVAERVQADFIVTRNGKDFSKGMIRACSPAELIDEMAFK